MIHRPGPSQPPRWTEEELDADRQIALTGFVAERGREGSQAYQAAFERSEAIVTRLFDLTDDLRAFSGEIVLGTPELLAAGRYLGGPPVSADDLSTLVGGRLGRRRVDPDLAQRVSDVLRAAWDPIRFPWLVEQRAPEPHEREAAIRWTAGIWAVEQLRTLRRTESSRRQELAVVQLLQSSGYELRARLRGIDTLDELPRGSFSRETSLAGSKCDIPVRLHDGRLLALECKVSNSALNSVKRLIRETGGKARSWRTAYGLQVLTGAVLSGVFKLGNLVDAQESYHIALFWQHHLDALREFVAQAAQ
jgi:hypothetical protein